MAGLKRSSVVLFLATTSLVTLTTACSEAEKGADTSKGSDGSEIFQPASDGHAHGEGGEGYERCTARRC